VEATEIMGNKKKGEQRKSSVEEEML